jgi:16S rRNA A1518/A1519 N6-dimethyltransferase RsmA/KsgA/DIM1 with predicted DNA glycosylase/AP lyase activity
VIGPAEIAALADSRLEQHFLVSPEKLAKIIAAAGIRGSDQVVELGAGIGTVASALPRGESLTLIELDARLTGLLRKHVPYARVLQGDALELIREIPCDVLISNLPHQVTGELLPLLPGLAFRTAVLAVDESTDLGIISRHFASREVTTVTGDDFIPPQKGVSRVVGLERVS